MLPANTRGSRSVAIDLIKSQLLGESDAMAAIRKLVLQAAPLGVPVLLEGETGTGKELVARALHDASGRRGNFVAVNVCAIAETMFEDTIFGHTRGAFTGAVDTTPGLLADANDGTILLDEIGGLPLAQQIKLLRAIETLSFRPVGAVRERRSNCRVIAATNEPLRKLELSGRFRADLAQRLAAITVVVPPLRARGGDVLLLATRFLDGAFAGRGITASSTRIVALAARDLVEYSWPGNVRELKHLMESSALLVELSPNYEDDVAERAAEAIRARRRAEHVHSEPFRQCLSPALAETLSVYQRAERDADETARQLGIHRTTVFSRLRRLREIGIAVPPAQRRKLRH